MKNNVKTVTIVCEKKVSADVISTKVKAIVGGGMFTVITNGNANVKAAFKDVAAVKVRIIKATNQGSAVTLSERDRATKMAAMATEAVVVFCNDLQKSKAARYTAAAAIKAGKPLYIVTEDTVLEGKEA